MQDSFPTNTHSQHDITQIARTTNLIVLYEENLLDDLLYVAVSASYESIVYPDRAECVLESTLSH